MNIVSLMILQIWFYLLWQWLTAKLQYFSDALWAIRDSHKQTCIRYKNIQTIWGKFSEFAENFLRTVTSKNVLPYKNSSLQKIFRDLLIYKLLRESTFTLFFVRSLYLFVFSRPSHWRMLLIRMVMQLKVSISIHKWRSRVSSIHRKLGIFCRKLWNYHSKIYILRHIWMFRHYLFLKH